MCRVPGAGGGSFSHSLAAPGFPPGWSWLPRGVPVCSGCLCSSNPTGVAASEGVATAEGGPSLDSGIPIPGAPLLGGKSPGLPPGPVPQRGISPLTFFFFGPFIGEDSAGPESPRDLTPGLAPSRPHPSLLPLPPLSSFFLLLPLFFLFSLCSLSYLLPLTGTSYFPVGLPLPPPPSPVPGRGSGSRLLLPLFCCG